MGDELSAHLASGLKIIAENIPNNSRIRIHMKVYMQKLMHIYVRAGLLHFLIFKLRKIKKAFTINNVASIHNITLTQITYSVMSIQSVMCWTHVYEVPCSVSGQVKPMNYKLDTCCFSALHSALIGSSKSGSLSVSRMQLSAILHHDSGSLGSLWSSTIKSPSMSVHCHKSVTILI